MANIIGNLVTKLGTE